MRLVFDATPLIYLGKVRLLEKLKKLPVKNYIPKSVYHEVVEAGFESDDAAYVKELVKEAVFEIVEVTSLQSLEYNPHLDDADIDVLSYAKEKNIIAVIDEKAGRAAAEIEHIKNVGSVYILFLLLKKKIISGSELKNALDKMIEHGWFCSTDLYAYILSKL